jgi:hypothetical protein
LTAISCTAAGARGSQFGAREPEVDEHGVAVEAGVRRLERAADDAVRPAAWPGVVVAPSGFSTRRAVVQHDHVARPQPVALHALEADQHDRACRPRREGLAGVGDASVPAGSPDR